MKKYILLIMIICGWYLGGCEKEDAIHVGLEYYGREYDSASSDPVLKYISLYYYKYGKTIILDPDTADYVFNFQSKNKLRIVAMEEARWEKSLEIVKELFLNPYSSKTIKDYFPFNLIIADSIWYTGGLNPAIKEFYSSVNFVAFALDKRKVVLSEDQKYDLSLKMHLTYLSSFCVDNGRWSGLPDAFYKVCEKNYSATDKVFATLEEAYAAGFTKIIKGGSWYPCPSKSEDLQLWVEFMLKTPEDEMTEIVNTYDAMKIKYNAIVEAFTEMGIDYKSLVYKKKNL